MNRYLLYPWRVGSRRADLVHVLDHSYAHLLRSVKRAPRVVTVHDLVPVQTVERKAASLKEDIRNRLLGRVLDGLRRADAWIVATAETPIPYSPSLEDAFLPSAETIVESVRARLGTGVETGA